MTEKIRCETTLYDKGECPFCWKVRLALAYKSIPFHRITIDTNNKPTEFMQLSPTGKVPLLHTDQQVLYESTLIALYLEDWKDTPSLLPGNALENHHIRWLNHFSDTAIGPAIRDAIFMKRGQPEDSWDEQVLQRCSEQWIDCLKQLAALQQSDTAMIKQFSLAECALIPRFALAQRYQIEGLEQFPRLLNWYNHHKQQPYFSQTEP